MTFGSLFSGIEAASVAWEPLGWKPAWFAEIDPFPAAVLAHRWPDVPNLGDVGAPDFIARALGPVDLIVGGPPCQAFSVAGLRRSLADDRGNLTLRFVEIVRAIDPKFVVWENVPGVLNTQDNAFGHLLAGLVGADAPLVSTLERGRWPDAGLAAGPERTVAWRVLNAQYFGLAQRRRRVFLVGVRSGDRPHPGQILFEPEGVPRHSPPSQEAGAKNAQALTGRLGVVGTLTACGKGGRKHGWGPTAQDYVNWLAVVVNARQDPIVSVDRSGPLGAKDTGHAVAVSLRGREGGATTELGGDVSPSIRASQGGGDKPHVLTGLAVRRLTPRECERLMGFPDDYTRIPWRGKLAEDCPDGPRYKALGNSIAVPVLQWIGKRIKKMVETA